MGTAGLVLLLLAPFAAQELKLPVPSRADQKRIEKEIRDLYPAEYASNDPERLRKFVRALADQAEDEANDAASRYVLLLESGDLAVRIRDIEGAVAAVDRMAALFAVDGPRMKAETLSRLRRGIRTPAEATLLAASCLRAAEEALEAEDHDSALDLARDGERAAKSARSTALLVRARDLAKRIPELKREAAVVAKKDPGQAIDVGDRSGNLNLGRYLCFVKGEWERGLEYFLWAGDAQLKAVAEKELKPPAGTADRLAVADGWMELGERERSKVQSERYQSRALKWYREALAGAQGLVRKRIEQKLNELHRKGIKGLGLLSGRGLLGAWNLDEGAGTRVTDATGNGNAGVMENAEGAGNWVSGDSLAPRVFQPDGRDDYIRIGGAATWNRIDKQLTVTAWVYLNEDSEGGKGIVGRRQVNSDRQHFALGIADRQLVALVATAEDAVELESSRDVPARRWVHLALTYDGSRGRLYMDGKEVYSEEVTGAFVDDDNPVIIAGLLEEDGKVGTHFPGRIARVRLYDRALSPSELSALVLGDR